MKTLLNTVTTAACCLTPQFHTSTHPYPDFDCGPGSSTEPVAIRAEHKSIDGLLLCKEGVEMLAFVEIPQHSHSILRGERAD